MRRAYPLLLLLLSAPLFAARYTVTAQDRTIHVGDPLPPLGFTVSAYNGRYGSVFRSQPALKTTATRSSTVGKYPITIAAGTMRPVQGGDSLDFVSGTLTILPPDGTGAQLVNGNSVPAGYFEGPAYPMLNVKSNPVAKLAGDCVTDDTAGLQALFAWGRDQRSATVDVNGSAVVARNGLSFAGLRGPVQLNGKLATIASVEDPTHMTLSAPMGIVHGARLRVGGTTVDTGGTTVTATSGASFVGLVPKNQLLIDGVAYQVASVSDAMHLQTTAPIPPMKGVHLIAGPVPGAWGRQPLQLYFPAGCYLVSKPLALYGNYWTLQGDGPQTSYIRLAPDTDAFNGPAKTYLMGIGSNNRNQNFREFIFNLGFNIGPGNPQAEAVHWVANNLGAMRNVQIWCDDANCLHGLSLQGAYAGPAMIKDVAIYGGKFGVQAQGQVEYQVTFENLTTEGQLTDAIRNGSFKLPIRHWLSAGAVPALESVGNGANTSILDSRIFFTGQGTVTGISNAVGGILYGRGIICMGFRPCLIDSGTGTPNARELLPKEFWTGTATSVFESEGAAASLNLPVKETPNPPVCAASNCNWQALGADAKTWPAAVKAARSATLYLPPGSYAGSGLTTIDVPESVSYINFNNAQFDLFSSKARLEINVAGSSSAKPLIIDGCVYNSCYIRHTGSRVLVVRDSQLGYQAAPGSGDVLMEDANVKSWSGGNDADGPTFYPGQHLWFRDLNIEQGVAADLRFPKFICDGATMWILGYKTEQDSPSVVAKNQCRAEIFNFFFYQLHLTPTPPGSAPIEISDSSVFATGFVFVNAPGFGAQNWVNETQTGSSRSLPSPGYPSNVSQMLGAFYSRGAEKAEAAKRR